MGHASNSRRSTGQRRKALARASGSALLEIADRLSMHASQIREHVADPRNNLPSRWTMDDLLRDYDDARNTPNNKVSESAP